MKLTRTLFSTVAALAIASPVFAQFDPSSVTSTDQLHLVSAGPFVANGLNYGTYQGSLLLSPGQPVIDIWCTDFRNHFVDNQNINITRFDADQATFDARTRFGYANLDNYMKAAYLTRFFSGLTVTSDVEDLHYAIWHLLTPTAPTPARPGESVWTALLANNQWQNINTKYWFVLSAQNMTTSGGFPRLRGSQEMLTMVAPEPSAVLLVSTGLLGIVGLARVRRRSNKKN